MEDEGGSDENQLNGRMIKVNTSKLICKIRLSKPTQTARKKNVQHTLCTYSPSLFLCSIPFSSYQLPVLSAVVLSTNFQLLFYSLGLAQSSRIFHPFFHPTFFFKPVSSPPLLHSLSLPPTLPPSLWPSLPLHYPPSIFLLLPSSIPSLSSTSSLHPFLALLPSIEWKEQKSTLPFWP